MSRPPNCSSWSTRSKFDALPKHLQEILTIAMEFCGL